MTRLVDLFHLAIAIPVGGLVTGGIYMASCGVGLRLLQVLPIHYAGVNMISCGGLTGSMYGC